MKIKTIQTFCATALLLFASCEDFLDRQPISDNVDEGFFTAENQLEPYCNKKYDLLPDHGTSINLGRFQTDNNSDDMAGVSPIANFIPQQVKVGISGSYGQHGNLRDCNRFLYYTEKNLKNGTLANSATVQQYIGEMYFFRAYIYFNYLKSYGDFPILTTFLTDGDYSANVEANKRRPRNEVARFILEDLDNAIAKLQPRSSSITAHRLNRESAQLFKSRVALYEGTWETYHKGTARVPGGPGWPGGTFNGNLDTEIAFFLDEAMKAAQTVADAITLGTDYAKMFNQTDLGNQSEVLLWRMYSETAGVMNSVMGVLHGINDFGVLGNGTGYTRSLVESFLMKNGLPTYAEGSNFQGDENLTKVTTERDNRLTVSMAKPGDKIYLDQNFTQPALAGTDAERSTTGYLIRKGWDDTNTKYNSPYPLALTIFRAAEAYLNYIEADYVKNKSLDANSKKYWKALRTRAQVDTDYQKTIDNTDLSKENDLAKYSGTDLVDKTLYNIRRERRCEFIAEGMRRDDLYRWRALDMMQNYQVEGFNYWDENYETYAQWPAFAPVEASVSKYLRPYHKNELAKDGYNFEVANYLSPLSIDVFETSTPEKGGDISTSVVYQNPGWPVKADGYAIK
ncbi:RagB/SusD family nutrient uptake outer membrane protein [Bacteroides fragilis]|uniref:RagB/SusD family nutrient uptake outer membrane protein n=1 Tax=Bacteroides fragilis TaxID=817 RepID=UPI0020309080|nr:RagB/SusD family nutrient uptake outer membrane protein [Bacteroides fragilis]MCM0238260.1 RagB/SusD family nutrient uptake outer membrane protein [Bacteroides fragilis]